VTETKLVGAGVATKPTFYRNVKTLVSAGIARKDTDTHSYITDALVSDPNGEE
jgi:hypothetical protein